MDTGIVDVLLLTNDLASGSRVSAAAARAGVSLQQFHAADRLISAATDAPDAAVILELATVRSGIAELVAALRDASPAGRQIIAFAPHVHEALIAAAQDAGCDRVLSRGQFFKGLDGLISELAECKGDSQSPPQ